MGTLLEHQRRVGVPQVVEPLMSDARFAQPGQPARLRFAGPLPRCHKALAGTGHEGRVQKPTGERWFLGHTVGIFESRGAPKPR